VPRGRNLLLCVDIHGVESVVAPTWEAKLAAFGSNCLSFVIVGSRAWEKFGVSLLGVFRDVYFLVDLVGCTEAVEACFGDWAAGLANVEVRYYLVVSRRWGI
jgi:hypothetical protein